MGQKIASIASQVGMHTFREIFSVLEELLDFWENNMAVVVVPKDEKTPLEQNNIISG